MSEVSFFNPQQELEVKRRRKMAELMQARGQMPKGTEMLGQVAVQKSPLEYLAAALSQGMAGVNERKADEMDAENMTRKQKLYQEAINAYGSDPNAAAMLLGQGDDAAQQQALGIQMAQNKQAQMMEMLGMKASLGMGGGNTPAAIQIADRIQKALAEGDYQTANILSQSAKMYDKGINMFGAGNGQMSDASGMNANPPRGSLTASELAIPTPAAAYGVQAPEGSNVGGMPVSAEANDALVRALQETDQAKGVGMNAPQPAPFPQPATMQPQPIPNYGGALGNVKAGVKGAEKRAETLNSPIPETAMSGIQEKDALVSQLGGVNADLGKIVESIGGNDLTLGPAENAASMARNWAAMSNPNSRNFQTLNSTLQRQRNASLMLAKGVQTEGDADRAWSELMANLNDAQNVSRRLQEIQNINMRSAQLQSKLANESRRNYGRPEVGFDSQFQQPATVQMENKKPAGVKFLGFE